MLRTTLKTGARALHTLPPLPFEMGPVGSLLSEKAMNLHYNGHHAGYVNKANQLIKGTQWESKSLEATIVGTGKDANQAAIFNNVAQILNHSFYWNCLSPKGAPEIPAMAKERLEQSFGSVDAFKQKFSEAAVGLFGSGWTWLCDNHGKLEIVNKSNAGNPIVDGKVPLLTVDVWEHAYYLDHLNKRADFINQWWKHVNWSFLEQNLTGLKAQK